MGIAITAAGSAYADEIVESIIGKTVQGQFPVKISGKQIEAQAAVVDGTSYLPVRAVGEALNMDVSFDSSLGIELKAKGEKTVTTTPQANPNFDSAAVKARNEARIERNNKNLDLQKKRRAILDEIPQYSNIVMSADHKKKTDPNYKYDEAYYAAKKVWEDKKAELVEIDKQIAELNQSQ
ncbi:MAG: hypothetical protein K0Q73_8301 [Paenibacillus sp.]|nr:hypothetical protein [Paenibacillus sp.]